MSKLEIINESISEIREILGAECASIEDLPEMVRQYAEDPSRSGFTTAFVFSSENSPNNPEGGILNTETGLVEGLDSIWTQTTEKASTFKLRAISQQTAIWMSFAIFNPSGERVTEWSNPVNLKGAQGEPGKPGESGAVGPAGPQGPKGDSSNSYRTVSVYTTTEDTTTPARPEGGSWDLTTNTVIPPSSVNDKYKWYLNADEPPKNNYLWMSQVTFGEEGEPLGNWCTPFRLTGEAGKSGADGRVTEFIYRLLPDYKTYEDLSNHLLTNKLYSPTYEDDKIPAVNDYFNIGTSWTDQPEGITETMQIEVCCTRTRKGVGEPWSEWSNCVIWAKWGEDGMDGDGVEYIYLVTPETLDGEPITSDMVSNLFMPDRDEAMKHEYYQQDEFCFNGNWLPEYKGYDWSDEPKDVGPGKPLEWVSIRKKKKNEKGVVEWGRFSDPKIWGRFSEDGYSYKTSFVFKRATEQPNQPTGGSFDNPKPKENGWDHSIPPISVANNLVGPVWMSSRTFYAGNENFDTDWTYPTILADTHNFQVEYTRGNEAGLIPNIDPFTGNENAWRESQLKYGVVWGDDDTINDPIWMATSSCDNGIWSNWVVTKIKGERGPKGENGSSVKIKHKFPNESAIRAEWERYLETEFFLNDKLDTGDGFYAEDTGLLWVYSGGYDGTEEDTDFDLYWQGVALKGEPGDSAYLYTAFADAYEGRINFVAGKWIGIRASDKALDPDLLEQWGTYTWTQWQGEDGWGQEQVFLLTNKDAGFDPANGIEPALPINEDPEYKVAGYLPLHNLGDLAKGEGADRWADSPLTVSEEWPYCWVASRKIHGNEFGPWKGDSDGEGAALYSRYSYDGLNGKSPIAINLTNDLAVIPMEGDSVDPDFIQGINDKEIDPITTSVQVFIGDDAVPNDKYTIVDSAYFTVNDENDTLTLNIEKIGDLKEVPVTVKVEANEYKTTWKIFKTDAAYELEPSLHVIKRYSEGENAGSLENPQFTVKVWKWSDDKWIASNKAVFVKIRQGENERIYSNEDGSNVITTTINGVATINLSSVKDITGVRLFIAKDDIGSESNALSFEDIAVVADGKTGAAGLTPNASFKSTVFIRSNETPDKPEGGSYNDPKPDTAGWEDYIPSGTSILWASTRVFSSDGKYPQEKEWSEPAQMTDTADFDVEFSSFIGNPGTPSNPTNGANWSNTADKTTIWMATRKAKNGVWGDWRVSKIKGESGDDGHSIIMKGTISELPETGTVVGEGYNVDGILYIWDGDSWVDCGKIKGEDAVAPIIVDDYWAFWNGTEFVKSEFVAVGDDGHSPYIKDGIWWEWDGSKYVSTGIKAEGVDGTSNFIHVKYASEVTTNEDGYGITGKFTESDGEVPGKYMGVYVDDIEDDPLDITKYKWTKNEGEDGFGYEYIYKRTNSDVAPDVPTDITEDDVAPTNWTDGPSGVTSTEMYEWVCYRKKISGVWTKWIGTYSDPAKAALWAKWGETGPPGPSGEITEEEKTEIENAVRDAVLQTTQTNLEAAKSELSTNIETAKNTLNDAIEAEKLAREGGINELKEAQKELANAASEYARKTEVQTSLTDLEDKYFTDGKLNNGLLNENEIYDLSKAALGINAEVGPNDMAADTVFAQYVVGVVGNYYKLKAENIEASVISGALTDGILNQLSIYSGTNDDNSAWALKQDGSGKLANGQISWNEDGSTVRLGSNVKISWANNVSDSDKDTIVNTAQNGMVSTETYDSEIGDLQTRMSTVEDDLPNYVTQTELSDEIDAKVNGLGFVTNDELNEYLKSSDLNANIELYLQNETSEVADIIGDSILDKLGKDKIVTELGETYVKTGTTISNTMLADEIYGKSIKNDSTGSIWAINEDGSASFCSKKINFNEDGSGNIGTGIEWDTNGKPTLSNSLIFKAGHLSSGTMSEWLNLGSSHIDLDEKQNWVLETTNQYGTWYTNASDCLNNNITNINILNIGGYPAIITNGDVPIICGDASGALVIPNGTLFTGMTFDGNCYCSSNYSVVPYVCKDVSGNIKRKLNFLTPWTNPGYDLNVHDVSKTNAGGDYSVLSGTTTYLSLGFKCPKAVVQYSSDNDVLKLVNHVDGENGRIVFTVGSSSEYLAQFYINIYFYFEDLCIGRYCEKGVFNFHAD